MRKLIKGDFAKRLGARRHVVRPLSRKAWAIVIAMTLIGLLGIGQLVGALRDRMGTAVVIQAHQMMPAKPVPKRSSPKKVKPEESPCYRLKTWDAC